MQFFLVCIGYLSKLDGDVFWIEEALDVSAHYAHGWSDRPLGLRKWSSWDKNTPAGSR